MLKEGVKLWNEQLKDCDEKERENIEAILRMYREEKYPREHPQERVHFMAGEMSTDPPKNDNGNIVTIVVCSVVLLINKTPHT